jgi:hypothetical protein
LSRSLHSLPSSPGRREARDPVIQRFDEMVDRRLKPGDDGSDWLLPSPSY